MAKPKEPAKRARRPVSATDKRHHNPGRPPIYTEAIATDICTRLADGASLRAICRDAEMPDKETVRHWLRTDENFLARYARARAESADVHAEDILDIADNPDIPADQKKIMVETRKWIACKLKPRVYGERVSADISGTVTLTLEQLVVQSLEVKASPVFTEGVKAVEYLNQQLEKPD